MQNQTAVIGGGPAGMTAALFACAAGASVTLYERNHNTGRKLGITGKGRCNLTNNCTPTEFLNHVTANSKFLYSSIFKFSPSDTIALFESYGVPLKTERGNRVFPLSDKAADIVTAMHSKLMECGVKIVNECRIKSILKVDGNNSDAPFEISDGENIYKHSSVIICTGGLSYPKTGSTGDGYKFAERFGIKTSPRSPSLVPIDTVENTVSLAGLTLKNVVLTVKLGNNTVFSEMGELLFTHTGISGPLVLSASANMQAAPADSYRIYVDLKPAIPEKELNERLINIFRDNASKDFINSVSRLLPSKLIPYTISVSGIQPHMKAAEITREMREGYLKTLKHLPITPVSFRPISEAVVTHGGISVSEINPRTMESKKVPGLFFAGEVLDVDAYTGGFNLQIAFSTGVAAGTAAAQISV